MAHLLEMTDGVVDQACFGIEPPTAGERAEDLGLAGGREYRAGEAAPEPIHATRCVSR